MNSLAIVTAQLFVLSPLLLGVLITLLLILRHLELVHQDALRRRSPSVKKKHKVTSPTSPEAVEATKTRDRRRVARK